MVVLRLVLKESWTLSKRTTTMMMGGDTEIDLPTVVVREGER